MFESVIVPHRIDIMPKVPLGLLLPALAAFLGGCANFAAVTRGMPARQVETLVGAPAGVSKNADGSEVWEYPRGPLGVETYLVTLGSDRAVQEVRQVLSDETISDLHVGMSRDEVRRLLGRPRDIGFSSLDDEIGRASCRGGVE